MSTQPIKAKLSSPYCLNLGGLIALTVLAYSYGNSYAAFFIPIFFGFSILLLLTRNKESVSIDVLIALSPAVGFSLLILMMYAGSALNIGLASTVIIYNLMALFLSAYLCSKSLHEHYTDTHVVADVLAIIVPILFVVLVHWAAYTYPTDNVDNLFHATKIEYLLKYNSMYPKTVPVFNIFTYPGGYHSIVAYIISITKVNIPEAMKTFRILAWALFSLGVYMFSRTWFSKKIARFSILAILATNICYYYLIVYIEPNFTGFYFFLIMLSLAYSYLNDTDIRRNLRYFNVISMMIGAAAIFVHPYSFQNFVFMITVYIVITQLRSINKNYAEFLRKIMPFAIIYGAIPLGIYTLLNPFFVFPELAKVHIEYPWASDVGIAMSHLAIFHGRNPHDTWGFFKLLLSWSTIRNENYVELIFMVLSAMYIIFRGRSKKAEYITVLTFFMFVFGLIINRLTINAGIPFYGTAALERMYLWLVPLFPVLIGIGFYYSHEIAKSSNRFSMKTVYLLLVIAFFLTPTWGTARDLMSAEANFYVTPDVMEDFIWINEHVNSHYILNSCYSDPTPWLPFFVGSDKYTILFNERINRCRFNNMTLNSTLNYLFHTNSTLPDTIAYIDTNAPSLNPLLFATRYQLLYIGKNNWIFNLSSTDTKNNTNLMLKSLRLYSSILPGNTFEYGRYYVWGFTKKYFYTMYYMIEGKTYAWLLGNQGIIAFNPCKKYNTIEMSLNVISPITLNITINDKLIGSYRLSPGEHILRIKSSIILNRINTIKISKTPGVLLIGEITFKEGDPNEESAQ